MDEIKKKNHGWCLDAVAKGIKSIGAWLELVARATLGFPMFWDGEGRQLRSLGSGIHLKS